MFMCVLSMFCLRKVKKVSNYVKNTYGNHKFFFLISISEDLLSKLASDMRLGTYDMKEDFHTTYLVPERKDDHIELNRDKKSQQEKQKQWISDLAPLRDTQKIQILM